MKKRRILSKISTRPSPNALKWAGQEISILSNILLWTLWLCRVFSLLQIAKLIYRKIITVLHVGSTDKNATRPNVPPMFCEIYFILWALVFGLGYFLGWQSKLLDALAYYYLFESFVWLLYYTVFRRFYEENYSIYHEMEYFSVVILLVPTQAFAFTNLFDMSFGSILISLMGAGGDTVPLPMKLFGTLFSAIVIGMIITAFPAERVKKEKKTYRLRIIGNGDVVQNRMYPALLAADATADAIKIYDLGESQQSTEQLCLRSTDEALTKEITRDLDSKSVVFVATPSYAHMGYLKSLLADKTGLIVMEKPITCKREELNQVEALLADGDIRDRLFFLSYYVLEKALPLTYLVRDNEAYAKYLDIDDKQSLHNWRFRLGALQSADVHIVEGEDSRAWTYEEAHGGHVIETFIHNVLIASLLCGLPTTWKQVEMQEQPSFVELSAISHNTKIHLSMRKNAPIEEKTRTAAFTFAHGKITLDFDDCSAKIYFEDLDKTTNISVKSRYCTKYHVQMEMVKSVATGELLSDGFDGLYNQIPVLRWLLDLAEQDEPQKQ